MSNFLYTTDKETIGRVDIDSLFEKKQQKDIKQLSEKEFNELNISQE